MDQRLSQLTLWINQQLNSLQFYQGPSLSLEVVSGDASFRRYFRCRYPVNGSEASVICVDAPPDKEDNPQFARIAKHYLDAGVPVPELLATDFEQGFMMLSDLGDCLLKAVLNESNAEQYFHTALQQLICIMQADFSHDPLPSYDSALLQREMELFREWFCGQYLELPLAQSDHDLMNAMFQYLEQQALQQVQVPVHRDYHTRNLMVLENGALGVIDFQDAVQGAVTYDLLSLLRDETFPSWKPEQVKRWALNFAESLRRQGIMQTSDQQFWHDFNCMGAQRHIKVAGIFARLCYRDGKQGYLEHIPQSLFYILQECEEIKAKAPVAAEFQQWLKRAILPRLIERLPQAASVFKDVV